MEILIEPPYAKIIEQTLLGKSFDYAHDSLVEKAVAELAIIRAIMPDAAAKIEHEAVAGRLAPTAVWEAITVEIDKVQSLKNLVYEFGKLQCQIASIKACVLDKSELVRLGEAVLEAKIQHAEKQSSNSGAILNGTMQTLIETVVMEPFYTPFLAKLKGKAAEMLNTLKANAKPLKIKLRALLNVMTEQSLDIAKWDAAGYFTEI